MKENKNAIKIFAFLVILLVLSQGATLYFLFSVQQKTLSTINSTEARITERINQNSADTTSKINALTSQISTLTSSQSDIQTQISKIKATTSADFSGIIEQDIQGVVTIKTDVAQGTGFLITDEGYILTNAHVLSGANYAEAYTYDSQSHSAKLIGYDGKMDIALLKITGNFESLRLGNSDSVKLGEKVIAIGNPLGLSFSTSEGIISARDRIGINNLPYYFQTDASLNPGNSGGPLINTNGDVIGINNFKITSGESLGFALEINYARNKVNEITLKALNQTIV